MKQWIGEILAPFSDMIYTLVMSIPLGAVRVLVFGILAALAVWVLMLPPQFPESTVRGKRTFIKDLRLYALAVIVLQALLYIIF